MPFPECEEMDGPLLCFILLNGGSEHRVSAGSSYEPLANFFKLTENERIQRRPDGHPGLHWHNRVQWTRQRLVNHGYLDGSHHGVWKLTPEGVEHALRELRLAGEYEVLRLRSEADMDPE